MDSLCRVCIDKATKCTSLNTKIEDSSNLTIFDFFNKCTSLNARRNDKLPQSLCLVYTDSIRRFYAFVKLAENSNAILREALSSISTGRYGDNREITCEEIMIPTDKIKANANATGSSHYILDIVKEKPRLSQSPPIAVKLKESDKFGFNLDHPQRSVEESDDILSCLASHLESIHAEHSDYEDNNVPVSSSKRRLVIDEEIEASTNSTETSLYSLDIVKEERRLSQSPAFIAESDELHSNLDHPEGSIGVPDDILSYIDDHLINTDAKHSVTDDDDLPISILKRRLVKNNKSDSQKMEIESSYKCKNCDVVFNNKEEFRTHLRNHVCEEKHECNICEKLFVKSRYLQIHLETQHLKKGLKCSICGKNFKCPANLRRHMGTHNGRRSPPKKLFGCEICRKKFTEKYLKRHMEVHSGIIKKCDQCDKEYYYTDALRRHKRWHKNPKPFRCENCGKLFANKFDCTYHTSICKPLGNPIKETRKGRIVSHEMTP